MIPHDLDTVLSRTNWSLTRWANVPALNRLLNHPQVRPLYFATVQDILHNYLLGERGQIAIEESLGPLGESFIAEAKRFLVDRAAYVQANLLQESNTIQTVHPVDDGLRLSNRPNTHLHGTAHHAANSVLVNGKAATFNKRTNRFELGSNARITNPSVSSWRYLDDGSDQGTAWKEANFQAGANWKEGLAQLGFGDGDERTVIDFGPDPNNKHITTYFRHEFDVPEARRYYDLNLFITRDDGVIVYLNGNEIWRSNLPPNVNSSTLAEAEVSGSNERNLIPVSVDPSHLRDGTNVLAVELHLASPDSPDASMTAYMTGRYVNNNGVPLHPGVNRVHVESYSGAAGTGELLASTPLDFWYDDGDVMEIAGELTGDNTWTAAAGPYLVTADLTIPADSKLTIEPGTSVYFAADAELIVNGILSAKGNANNRIRFTSDPAAPHVPNKPNAVAELPVGPPRWDGIHFNGSRSPENVVAFADIEYAQDNGGSIGVVNSALQRSRM